MRASARAGASGGRRCGTGPAAGVLAQTDLPRLYLQSSVFARGSGAACGPAARRGRGAVSASIARIGPPAFRSCFRTSSTSRACGRGSRGGRGDDARRDGAVRRSAADRHQPAGDRGGDGRGRPRDLREYSDTTGRRAARARRRRARATRPASRASLKSPTRRACSRRGEEEVPRGGVGARGARRAGSAGGLAPFTPRGRGAGARADPCG